MNCRPGHGHRPQQSEHQLHKIGDHHSPKPSGHGVSEHQYSHNGQQDHRVGNPPESRHRLVRHDAQGFHHLAHRQEGIANADAVHRQCQQKRLRAPQPGSGRTSITQLSEGRIRQHATAAPQRSKHHSHGDMGETKTPPLPVTRQTAGSNQPGHIQRGIDREGGGRHRGTRQPTIETAPGNEIIVFTAIPPCQPEPQHQCAKHVEHKNQPVDASHGPSQMGAVSLRNQVLACFVAAIDRKQRSDLIHDWLGG